MGTVHGDLGPFVAGLPFSLSAYQEEALAALEAPEASVVVVAPTGSGKSVIADAAIWQALSRGATAAYSSPLRALANQRFAQLSAVWGARAGLITGETVLRPEAPCRVMTAELFRTLARLDARHRGPGEPFFRHLGWAVFDEAHYLSDPQRGAAWEEAILATPPQARILCLSATIGEPQRLIEWLRWLGRPATLIEARERPVPLRHYLYLREDLRLVLDEHGERGERFPFAGGWALARRAAPRIGGPPGKRRVTSRPAPLPGLPSGPPEDWIREQALGALTLLRQRQLTPTIAFVPSRREAERLAADAAGAFPESAGGVAVHHAGLLPALRRTVETRLRQGDLWLVCGTTTLAAGLDVPARSVLLTSFGRFDGRAFNLLSPAEYRQLTGRAGRLGRDVEGAAVLLPSPWHGFEEAFRALTASLPPLQSAFRPTYATALAWYSGEAPDTGNTGSASQEERRLALATALGSTLGSFLSRSRGGRALSALAPPSEPDGPSRLQALALERLLLRDGLVLPEDTKGALTPRGAFVLHTGGGAEGRLLLRLEEAGAFAGLDPGARLALLAVVAAGQAEESPVGALYLEALRQQVTLERECGALLTPPPAPAPRSLPDPWRRREGAIDLLERALRAGRAAGLPLSLRDWGPALAVHSGVGEEPPQT